MMEERAVQESGKAEKRDWVSPKIQDWDIVDETQVGLGGSWDGSGYS